MVNVIGLVKEPASGANAHHYAMLPMACVMGPKTCQTAEVGFRWLNGRGWMKIPVPPSQLFSGQHGAAAFWLAPKCPFRVMAYNRCPRVHINEALDHCQFLICQLSLLEKSLWGKDIGFFAVFRVLDFPRLHTTNPILYGEKKHFEFLLNISIKKLINTYCRWIITYLSNQK